MAGSTFFFLLFLMPLSLSGALENRSHEANPTTHTTPTIPTTSSPTVTQEIQKLPLAASKTSTSTTTPPPPSPQSPSPATPVKRPIFKGTSGSRLQPHILSTVSPGRLPRTTKTPSADLANETVLHAHVHEDRVMETNASLGQVALGESSFFVSKIFHKYGSSERQLTLQGLRHLMLHLGLGVVDDALGATARGEEGEGGEGGGGVEEGEKGGLMLRRVSSDEDSSNDDDNNHEHHSSHSDENDNDDDDHHSSPSDTDDTDENGVGKEVERHRDRHRHHHHHHHDVGAEENGDKEEWAEEGHKVGGPGTQSSDGEKTGLRVKRTAADVDGDLNGVGRGSAGHPLKRRSVEGPVVISHNHGDHSECHALGDLLSAFHFDLLTDLDPDQFLLLCPALIDQLDNSGCHRHGNQESDKHLQSSDHPHDHDDHDATSSDMVHSHDHPGQDGTAPSVKVQKPQAPKSISGTVWLYSTIAVVAISLVGLLGVAVIPIIRGPLYKSLLQLLVALAVGALSGDALLHLLPHSLSPAHPKEQSVGNNHDAHDVNTTHSKVTHDHGDGGEDHSAVVYKGLVALLGLLFFFLAERILTILTAHRARRRDLSRVQKKSKLLELSGECKEEILIVPSHTDNEASEIRETAILGDDDVTEPPEDGATNLFLDDNHHPQHHDHESDHGHGHSHGEVPQSATAVVLMVIFGDGIHNFSDGLAIGAAFANSITGGFSTAVAVFCHELPHEIGDFAMLLSSGMTWRRAMLYNVLSSVLCFLGMVLGVFLGNLQDAVLWIFPAVAGMFLYISLADMLPELKLRPERMVTQLLTQCAGIATGAGIMLTIAIFEHDLKTLLD